MTGVLRRSEQAEEDLIDIWRYIAQRDLAAADRMLDRLEAASITLSENPRLGPARPDLAAGLRYFPVGRYVLLYREIAGGVEIVRCVHGARDLFRLALKDLCASRPIDAVRMAGTQAPTRTRMTWER